ncbi:Pyrroline-5-carboxylate reductase ProC [Helicobacter bizzozeronii]|nr:Pyrroline-5-carboxylate reductase ProC [Helicobacter bizzozeronii]
MRNLIVVGYGRMAQALLKGLAQNTSRLENYQLQITGRNPEKILPFLQSLPIEVEILPPHGKKIEVQDSIVLLAIKPYGLKSLRYEGGAHMVISLLAGVGVPSLQAHLQSAHYVRCMPNIAAAHALSATTMYAPSTQKDEARIILECLGQVVEVESEALLDASLATNGSVLAFLGMGAQGLISAGVCAGLSQEQSSKLVAQSFTGFAKLLETHSPQEIIEAITTPGGATIAGISVLEQKAFKGILMQACQATIEKGRTPSN